jgi:hypothetical protein
MPVMITGVLRRPSTMIFIKETFTSIPPAS